MKPADLYYGLHKFILDQRDLIKEQTLYMRKSQNL